MTPRRKPGKTLSIADSRPGPAKPRTRPQPGRRTRQRLAADPPVSPWCCLTGADDPAALIDWARASLAGPLREVALSSAAQQWAASDPRAAAGVLHELGDDRLRQQTAVLVAMRWFPQEPEAACAWAQDLDAGPSPTLCGVRSPIPWQLRILLARPA
ncbi:MAG: hypothetical protein HS113_27510 [Verrucomicrobiales bacterium]|nr:hypothetical protein [Verrucomicrobiales bacterium]